MLDWVIKNGTRYSLTFVFYSLQLGVQNSAIHAIRASFYIEYRKKNHKDNNKKQLLLRYKKAVSFENLYNRKIKNPALIFPLSLIKIYGLAIITLIIHYSA